VEVYEHEYYTLSDSFLLKKFDMTKKELLQSQCIVYQIVLL